MEKSARRKGVFLLGVMFLAVVVAMFATAALALAPASLQRSQQLSRRQAAERALRTGIDYALARIRATPGGHWRAQASTTLQLPGMVVREGDGQVEGWIEESGLWSRFRLSFNFRDGNGGADGLNDPGQPFETGVGVSVNNLPFNFEAPVPTANASGVVQPQSPVRFQLPPHGLLLSVEGASGQVASGAMPPTQFWGLPSFARVETVMHATHSGFIGMDSVASATGDLDFVVRPGQRVSFEATAGTPSRLRTKGSLNVQNSELAGAELVSPSGEIRTPGQGNQVGITQVASNIVRQDEAATDSFYSIALGSTPQPGAGAITLGAGVYEVNLVNGQAEVKHYEMTYADYKAQRLAGTLTGGTEVTLDPAIQLNVLPREGRSLVEVHLTRDAQVQANSVSDLAIVPAKGAFQEADVAAQLQTQPPLESEAVNFLVQLADQIQIEMASSAQSNWTINDHLASVQGGFSNTPQFRELLKIYAGGHAEGNLSITGGPSFAYNTSGLTVVNQFSTHWDGLAQGNYQLGSLRLAQHIWTNMTVDKQPFIQAFMQGASIPSGFGSGPPPDVGFGGEEPPPEDPEDPLPSDGLSVRDLKVRLEDEQGGSVTLRGAGETVLAGMLEGKGAAVVSPGNLSLLGNGVDLEASAGAASGVNLYSAGDILVDGFAFDNSASRYNSISLKGVMYAWGNIMINAGSMNASRPWAPFSLRGAMVAFGRDPAGTGTPQSRRIQITARRASMFFDPAYLLNLTDNPISGESQFVVRAYHQR